MKMVQKDDKPYMNDTDLSEIPKICITLCGSGLYSPIKAIQTPGDCEEVVLGFNIFA